MFGEKLHDNSLMVQALAFALNEQGIAVDLKATPPQLAVYRDKAENGNGIYTLILGERKGRVELPTELERGPIHNIGRRIVAKFLEITK